MTNRQDLVIFLDDGGVLNDGSRRATQWRRLAGEYFAPRYGGAPEAWASANIPVYEAWLARYRSEVWGHPNLDFRPCLEREQMRWLEGMFRRVGVEMPPPQDRLEVVNEAHGWICERVHAALPGAADTVLELHRLGHRLFTASGEESVSLEGYLRGMGIDRCFGRFYGPDLVNRPKEGPPFYARIFDDAGVEPSQAVVVDDMPLALSWARECGAGCVLVASHPQASPEFTSIAGLSELPSLLHETTDTKSL
jgi:HAD superfamily hydrolase (TIGR01509 family)